MSRTDTSQDITGQVGGAGMRLAEARALRTSLLEQLANATTTEQVDSLKAQIRDADAAIASDQAALNSLHRQVDYSRISVTIQGRRRPGRAHRARAAGSRSARPPTTPAACWWSRPAWR